MFLPAWINSDKLAQEKIAEEAMLKVQIAKTTIKVTIGLLGIAMIAFAGVLTLYIREVNINRNMTQTNQRDKHEITELKSIAKIEFTLAGQSESDDIPKRKPATREVLLAVGGRNDHDGLSSVELFNPTSLDGWQIVTHMPTGRRSGFGAAVLNNTVYVCGGWGDASNRSCIAYDQLTNSWNTSIADLIFGRENFALAVLNGTLYAIGGTRNTKMSEVEVYDVSSNKWAIQSYITLSIDYQSVATLNESLFIGVCRNQYDTTHRYSSFYRVELSAYHYLAAPNMSTPRNGFSLVAVPPTELRNDEGFLYAIGGDDGTLDEDGKKHFLDTVDRFDVATDQWDTKDALTLSQPRVQSGAALLDDDIYLVGGHSKSRHALNTVEILSEPSSDNAHWITSPDTMIEPRWDHALVQVKVEISADTEKQAFEKMMRWIHADEAVRSKQLTDRLKLIRLDLLDGEFLFDVLRIEPLIQKCEPCKLLIKKAVERHFIRTEPGLEVAESG